MSTYIYNYVFVKTVQLVYMVSVGLSPVHRQCKGTQDNSQSRLVSTTEVERKIPHGL